MKTKTLYIVLALTGCASTSMPETNKDIKEVTHQRLDGVGACNLAKNVESCEPYQATPSSEFKQTNINQYIRSMVHDLIATMDYADKSSVFGVTTFVYADSDLKQLPHYSHHIAESIQHELHMFGLPVIDFKSTGALRVTADGDFIRSRDYKELKGQVRMDYVVAGTLTPQSDGVWVNAKIIGIESSALVASSQLFIPNTVLDKMVVSQPARIHLN